MDRFNSDTMYLRLCSKNEEISENVNKINILVFGPSKTGKTTLIKTLLNPEQGTRHLGYSDKSNLSINEILVLDRQTGRHLFKLNIIDTPGIEDFLKIGSNYRKELDQKLLSIRFINVICITTRAGYTHSEDKDKIIQFINCLSNQYSKICMLILTHCDLFADDKINEFLKDIREDHQTNFIYNFCHHGIFQTGALDLDHIESLGDIQIESRFKANKLNEVMKRRDLLIKKFIQSSSPLNMVPPLIVKNTDHIPMIVRHSHESRSNIWNLWNNKCYMLRLWNIPLKARKKLRILTILLIIILSVAFICIFYKNIFGTPKGVTSGFKSNSKKVGKNSQERQNTNEISEFNTTSMSINQREGPNINATSVIISISIAPSKDSQEKQNTNKTFGFNTTSIKMSINQREELTINATSVIISISIAPSKDSQEKQNTNETSGRNTTSIEMSINQREEPNINATSVIDSRTKSIVSIDSIEPSKDSQEKQKPDDTSGFNSTLTIVTMDLREKLNISETFGFKMNSKEVSKNLIKRYLLYNLSEYSEIFVVYENKNASVCYPCYAKFSLPHYFASQITVISRCFNYKKSNSIKRYLVNNLREYSEIFKYFEDYSEEVC